MSKAMGGGGAQGESEDLPLANVKRVVKTKLQELALGYYGEERDVAVNKDALLAFSESAKIFIHFLSATYVLHLFFFFFFLRSPGLVVSICNPMHNHSRIPRTFMVVKLDVLELHADVF